LIASPRSSGPLRSRIFFRRAVSKVDEKGKKNTVYTDFEDEMGSARLYESPFTDIGQQGPEAMFLSVRVTEMVRMLDEIRAREAA
jgi:hypothetical protein